MLGDCYDSDIVHVFNTDVRYGITYWYTNTAGGGKLREMQYVWAFFNTMCAMCGVWVYLLWNEAVVGVHRDRRVFRQKVIGLTFHQASTNIFVLISCYEIVLSKY